MLIISKCISTQYTFIDINMNFFRTVFIRIAKSVKRLRNCTNSELRSVFNKIKAACNKRKKQISEFRS